ncbi:MAG: tRNA pseudouridine(38-40) synthase TruA [Clostridia bacterium]|nr:tRNA pseudouridine(38-40) synthase TruA [Clostridia bacterium]
MSRYLLTIKYDGSNYCGWQVQPNGVSVQYIIQTALKELLNDNSVCVTGCSRTDAGVHANMFCLHFDSDTTIPEEKIPFALNVRLPLDIKAIECKRVADDFHARYSSKGKTYIYRILNSPLPDPFKSKYSLQIAKPIDINLMNVACKKFVGTHDFAAFCSVGSSVVDTVRTVYACSADRNGDDIFISITANGFLYNMVRIIVGTLLEVDSGKILVEDIDNIITSKDRNCAGHTVKPHGLFLERVHYNEMDIC